MLGVFGTRAWLMRDISARGAVDWYDGLIDRAAAPCDDVKFGRSFTFGARASWLNPLRS